MEEPCFLSHVEEHLDASTSFTAALESKGFSTWGSSLLGTGQLDAWLRHKLSALDWPISGYLASSPFPQIASLAGITAIHASSDLPSSSWVLQKETMYLSVSVSQPEPGVGLQVLNSEDSATLLTRTP